MTDVLEQALRGLADLTNYGTSVIVERKGKGYSVRASFPNRPAIAASGPKLIAALIDCRELAAKDAPPCERCGQVVLDRGKLCLEHR
jgi:hypothetical protein